jgi:hypothetical protein
VEGGRVKGRREGGGWREGGRVEGEGRVKGGREEVKVEHLFSLCMRTRLT